MSELAYSLHLGSDKNRKPSSKNMAKNNKFGTTSLSNNAIQNARGLSRVDKHNYRKYDNNQKLIEIVKGSTSLYNDIVKLYKDEFEEAKEEYNSKQTRDDRKIEDYFKKISDNSKNDLACEIIIELGDKKYWDTKDDNFKHKMSNVFKEQVNDLEELVPDFKIASAIIHYDETSPHFHIVGVPIKYKNKNGMSKQAGKVEETNNDFKRTELLSVTLNNVDIELRENIDKNKILTENNNALSLKVKTLTKNIEKKDDEIDELKKENSQLKKSLDYFKNLFNKLVKFIKHKMFGKEKEREDYWEFSKNLYHHGIFSDDTIEDIKDDYDWNKENDKVKEIDRDDFEI